MNKFNKSCCVCLNSVLALNPLSQKDDNDISLLDKLKINIPQIQWFNVYQICEPCTNLLNIVNNFRETCIKSDIQRQKNSIREDLHVPESSIDFKTEEKDSNGFDQSDEYYESEGAKNDDDEDDKKFKDISDEEEEKKVKDASDDEFAEEITCSKKKRRLKNFKCEQCSEVLHSSTALIKHCVNEHDMDSKTIRPFACTRCSSRFANSSNLLQHIKYHDAVRSHMCTYCGKGFITKTDLNIHEKQHLNKREYKCENCGKCFNTHKDLRSHKLVVHTDPHMWKYFCEICNKHFPIKSNYDCHMRRHTGDKKFECHLCNRKFTDKCVLQRHMRTHSNVREWKCSECRKEYKDKRVMQIHMAKVHAIGVGEIKLPSKERKYICHICPKGYYAKNKLTRHLYTHTGEKPFYCTICDKKFNDKSYVKQHMKKTHNIKTESDR